MDVVMEVILVSLLLLILLGTCSLWTSSAKCSSTWEASGFQTEWGPIKGCRISKDGKIWLPASAYRKLD